MQAASLKQKSCAVCHAEFTPWRSTQRACSPKCALEFNRRKDEANRAKEQRRKDREWKRANRPMRDLLKDAQGAVNAFVRYRDEGLPCISCQTPAAEVESDQHWKVGGAWDAGHFRTRGAASHLRFNLFNLHRQCKSCNLGSGKYGHNNNKAETTQQQYRANLVMKIGEQRVERLECDNEPRTFEREYLERLTAIFRKRLRVYKKIRGSVYGS